MFIYSLFLSPACPVIYQRRCVCVKSVCVAVWSSSQSRPTWSLLSSSETAEDLWRSSAPWAATLFLSSSRSFFLSCGRGSVRSRRPLAERELLKLCVRIGAILPHARCLVGGTDGWCGTTPWITIWGPLPTPLCSHLHKASVLVTSGIKYTAAPHFQDYYITLSSSSSSSSSYSLRLWASEMNNTYSPVFQV